MNQQLQNRHEPAEVALEHTMMFERAPLSVPLNLGEWLAPELLAKWVDEAVRQLDPNLPEVINFLRQPAEERPETLLGVLLFAYCTQRYNSTEIVRDCHTDPLLLQLSGNKAPFPEELDHFRRKNRILLENLLGQLLIRAVQEKFIHQGQLPPGLQHSLLGRATDRIKAAHLINRQE